MEDVDDVEELEELGDIPRRAKQRVRRESRTNMDDGNEVNVPAVTDVSSRFDTRSLNYIKDHIFLFLRNHISEYRGVVNRAKVSEYLSTFMADLLADFGKQLDDACGPE